MGVSTQCDVCVYDEFKDQDIPCSEFINFIDYYKHTLNLKYRTCIDKYKIILITSIKNPKELYKKSSDNEESEQWLRRMKSYKIDDILAMNFIPIYIYNLKYQNIMDILIIKLSNSIIIFI